MRETGDRFKGCSHRRHLPPQPAWLQRLWQQEQVPLGGDKLQWWGAHVQNFLAVVRRKQWQGSVKDLIEQFVADLEQSNPPPPAWQERQIRQALEVFARGIDHWHFKQEDGGLVRPAFRLKTASEPSGPSQQAQSPVPEYSPVLAERHWRDRMIATLRIRSYSIRTERAYLEWVQRFLRFHDTDNPLSLDEGHIRQFLEHLAVVRNVTASTQNQAFSALLFLFQELLGHRSAETTQIYTHVMQKPGIGTRSPLDKL